jgi:hypothetical protein
MFMKTLSESLLDDFDTIAQRSDISMYLQQCYKAWQDDVAKAGQDVLGRQLKVGDLVICIAAYQPVPAVVFDIKNKKICIPQAGDGSDLKNSKGDIVYDEYKPSHEFLKISPEALKAIYLTK